MQQLDVFISVREKPRQSCISVIVKSIEQNAHCVYQVRDQLLQALTKGEVEGKLSPVRYDDGITWRDPDETSAGFEESFNAISHFSQSQRRRESLNSSEIQDATAAMTSNTQKVSGNVQYYGNAQQQSSSQVSSVTSPFADYTEKKQKATKGMMSIIFNICDFMLILLAIQHKVTFKELRVPQDAFCGSYFSASMPGQVVKEAMQNPTMMVRMCIQQIYNTDILSRLGVVTCKPE